MKVTVNPVLNMETLAWVGNDGTYEYDGPVVSFGGPSKESKANAESQRKFYAETTKQQGVVFSQQQGILKAIQDVTMPILKLGPNQYGFTPEEDALLRTEITTNLSQAEANAMNAAELALRQRTSGADVLPSGAEAEILTRGHLLSEQEKAKQLSTQRLVGYEAGKQRYAQALAALSGNAGLLSPTSYTQAAVGAGANATKATEAVDAQRGGLLKAVLGGVIGAGASFLTGGLSNITGGGSFFKPAPAPCWIAAFILNKSLDDPVVVHVRNSLGASPALIFLRNLYDGVVTGRQAVSTFLKLSPAMQAWVEGGVHQVANAFYRANPGYAT